MTKRLLATLLTLIASTPFVSLAASADWPQWRGVNRDGHSPDKGLLKEWPADGPKLLWKATSVGGGYTNVSVVGNRIFLMGEKADGSFVMALNRTDGQPLWTAKVGRAGAPGWGGFAGPRCTPTVDGNLVFAVGQYGEAVCVDAASGKELWRKDYEKDFGGRASRVGLLRYAAGRRPAGDSRSWRSARQSRGIEQEDRRVDLAE